ncbi:protein suppressor of underreplication isoform X2 [Eupeodes corollae]|uniref:protein suppressor of underreplication isoform X2 n=1 Tax=Eupeodes corollae TaxID=290404 RepID=UPI0024901A12|nr:protein suppressor of underreplication isoform X2 [Eupeodes corollae]
MPQLFHFVAEHFKESLMLGGQSQHMVAGRLCQYLKPWQLEGLRFLYKNHEKGEACILNDESGLGKVVTVSTFLGSILTNDTTKKCLIVVRDEQVIEEWRFHLSVLTHLTVKVIEKTTDINFETVFLIKWSTLKNIVEIDKIKFDHIIVDNRGDMLNNKFCTGILLRYFENKTTIIISSTDVTSDIKLLHILLRLCGRLERQFVDVNVFENKFQLPQLHEGVSKKVDLEDYFLKRERVINFCREFRLRRYCHQFDEQFPIVSKNEFQRHLEQWQLQNKNSLSSGSVKKEREICRLDEEVQRINENTRAMDDEDAAANISDDLVVMSPLVLVSESETESETDDDQTQIQKERNSQFIEEIKDTEDDIRDKVKQSKGSENICQKNRRKSEKPVKTPPSSNKNKMLLDDKKKLRSRTLTSPKKPLPISTRSRKYLETEKEKVDSAEKHKKDKETERRLKKQENVKKSSNKYEEKTKANKELGNKKLKENQEKQKGTISKKDDEKKNISFKTNHADSESYSSKKKDEQTNISNGLTPEKSSKKKQNEATKEVLLAKSKSVPETPKLLRPVRTKLRSDEDERDDKQQKIKTPSREDNEIQSNKEIQKNGKDKSNKIIEDKDNRKDENTPKVSSKLVSTISLMLEEAQKFVRNENIGKRTNNSKPRNRRSKKLEVPKIGTITIEDTESSNRSISTSKNTQTPTETRKQAANSIKKNTYRLTELKPVGVHSISTRGMQRHTRSNPGASKYMRVMIKQVGIEKKSSPKGISRRRKSVVLLKRVSPQTKPPKPPSPTPPVISESPAESIQLGQALTPTNSLVVSDFVAPEPRNFNYNFPLMLDRETSDSECQIASQSSNVQEVIVLTGSSTNEREMEPPKSTVSRRKVMSKPPMVTIPRPFFNKAKSPDLFSTCSDLSLPCSQQQTNKTHFEGFKIFGSELRQPAKSRSCLDILERMLEPRSGIIAGKKTTPTPTPQEKPKSSSHQHCVEDEDAMFEITTNGTFGNSVRINSNGEMSPIRNKSQSTPPTSGHPKNRITNYLISNSQHTSILAQPSPPSLDDITDLLPKTPKRRKSMSGNVKRSPRSLNNSGLLGGGSGKSQSTKLTQWLVKNSNSEIKNTESLIKPQSTKRRRLDLSFPDK